MAIRSANVALVIFAFSLHAIGFLISALRWRVLLRAQGSGASIPFLVESLVVGVFFNNLLPSTIGGDASRAYDSWRLGQTKSTALAVVFVDRFLGLLSLVIFALVAMFYSNALVERIPGLYLWLIAGAAAMLVLVCLIFMPAPRLLEIVAKIRLPFWHKIRKIVDAFLAFQGSQGALLGALGLSMLLQANVILHYFLISEALDLDVAPSSFFLIVPLAIVLMMIPVSVNAIGVRENVFAFFLAPFAVSKPEAIAFAWIVYGMVVVQGVVGGILYGLRR